MPRTEKRETDESERFSNFHSSHSTHSTALKLTLPAANLKANNMMEAQKMTGASCYLIVYYAIVYTYKVQIKLILAGIAAGM